MWPLNNFKPIRGKESILIYGSRGDDEADVRYVGPNYEALRNEGCITNAMYESFQVRHKGKVRRDADGDIYCRWACGNREQPDRAQVRLYIKSSIAKALALPGSEQLIDERSKEEPVRQVPKDFSEFSQRYAEEVGKPVIARRHRPVGRYRRSIEWAVIEGVLLVPNWTQLRVDLLKQKLPAPA